MGARLKRRADRLRRQAEFARAAREGRRYRHAVLDLLIVGNNLTWNRYGVAMTRGWRAGNVARNRARRLAREAWRQFPASGRVGIDVVVVLRVAGASFDQVKGAWLELCERAGVR